MSKRKKRAKKKQKRRVSKTRTNVEETYIPASPEVKRKLFHSLKYLYGVFLLSFATAYLCPVLLDSTFAKYVDSAVFGVAAGTICSLLVFGLLYCLLIMDHKSAEDLLDAIDVAKFSPIQAILFGFILGGGSGFIYPITAWLRPFTGGKSIDDVIGHFLWAPVGALMAVVMASTWCFSRRASRNAGDSRLAKLKMQMWVAGVSIAVGFWLLCTVADFFPRHRSGVDIKAPHAWVVILPLYIIVGSIGTALFLGVRQTQVGQAVKDSNKQSTNELTEPIETFSSTYGMRRLVEWSPDSIRIIPTGGLQIAGWLFMGSAFLVYTLVGAIALWAPQFSDGSEFPLLIITLFFLIGFSMISLPLRFSFDGRKKIVRYGNFWSHREVAFEQIEAVQIIDANGWQLNLITRENDERRIHIWEHDIETTQYAADRLARALKVDVLKLK